jgi:hypothetical protein
VKEFSMKRLLFLLCLVPLLCVAQPWSYTYSYSAALVGTPAIVTIQLPSGTGYPEKTIIFKGVSVYCSVECAFTVERDGTAATATGATVGSLNRSTPAPYALAFSASNVGAGTTLSAQTVPAGGTMPLDLAWKKLTNTGENVTVRTASVTGTVKITFQWEER